MLTELQADLRATARQSFWQAHESTSEIMEGLIATYDSDSDQETYPGLAYAPRPREMEGSRTHRSVPGFSFTIVNKQYESTVDISYKQWKYGKTSAVRDMLSSMGEKARLFPNRLVGDLLNAGTTTVGHDGQNFFHTAHVDAGARYTTAQDNDLTSNYSVTSALTVLEMYAELGLARTAFESRFDGEGDPVVPAENARFIVMCPSGHLRAARAVFKNDQITGPIANDLKGVFEPRLNPYSDNTAEFHTFWADGRRKPFILQEAEGVSLEDNMGGDAEFETKDISFGSFGFYNAGYGDWRYANVHTIT